jgi:hypothetical protein
MGNNRDRKARPNPLRKCGEFFTEISGMDDVLRDLRKRARPGADMLSSPNSIAALQVELITSSRGLLRLVDELGFQLLQEECPPQERIRRIRCLIRMGGRVQGTILRAIDIYLSCHGGMELIKIQAIAEWIKHQRERSPAEAAQIDQILEMMTKKSKK